MNKKQHPTLKRMGRKAVCVTIHAAILARLDARNGNRSEEINSCLARIFLIEDGRGDMTPEERRRFKILAAAGTIPESVEQRIDREEDTLRRQRAREANTITPKLKSPWLKSK